MPSHVLDPAEIGLGVEVEIVSTPNTFRLIEQAALSRTENGKDRYPVTAALRANVQALEVDAFGAPLEAVDRSSGAWVRQVRRALGDGQRPFCDRLRDRLHDGIVLGRGYVVATRTSETGDGTHHYVCLAEDPTPIEPRPAYTDPRWIRIDDAEVRCVSVGQGEVELRLRSEDGRVWSGSVHYPDGGETAVAGLRVSGLEDVLASAGTTDDETTEAMGSTPGATATDLALPLELVPEGGVVHVVDGQAMVKRAGATIRVAVAAAEGAYQRRGEAFSAVSGHEPETFNAPVDAPEQLRTGLTVEGLGALLDVADAESGPMFANLLVRPPVDGAADVVVCGPTRVVRRVVSSTGRLGGDLLVEARALRPLTLAGGDDRVRFAVKDGLVTVEAGGVSVTTAVAAGRFPPYAAHIPRRAAVVARLDRAAFLDALDRVESNVDPERMTVEIVARADGFDVVPWSGGGAGQEVLVAGERLGDQVVPEGDAVLIAPVDITCYNPGKDSIGGFRLDYLRDAARATDATFLRLAGTGRNRPFVLYPETRI